LAQEHSIELAARTATRFLASRHIEPSAFDGIVLGFTVPQAHCFYGAPWLAGMIGMTNMTGPNVSQACATSARALLTGAAEVETGLRQNVLCVACDRTSNGPHVYYPNPRGIGGRGEPEDPVWDNFNKDPHAGQAMIQTAENVVRAAGIRREEQDAMVALRHRQYADALANDRAFQRRYMLPVEIGRGKKATQIAADEGISPLTEEEIAQLKPVLEGGIVTSAGQTFPADGNAGIVVCSNDRAMELSHDKNVRIHVVGFGEARVAPAMMPMAVVPAARAALEHAGVGLSDCKAIKTHNPFVINDVYFCKETGTPPEKLNRFGSPLVYGHPQGPTGMRAMIELCEELVMLGGGYGLFTGCAAGDTAMAIVISVDG